MARIALLAALTLSLTACQAQTLPFKTVTSEKVGDKTVAFQTPDGSLKMGSQDVQVTFTDVANKAVAVTAPALTLSLAPGGGASSAEMAVTLSEIDKGAYSAKVDLGAQGNWQGRVTWSEGGKPQAWRFATMVI